MNSKTYKIVPCVNLINSSALGGSKFTAQPWCPDGDVAIPSISYGDLTPPAFPHWQWPPDSWFEPSFSVNDAKHFLIENARIHTETGIVTVGDYCIKESLYLVFPEVQGLEKPSEDEISIPSYTTTEVDEAVHSCCGYVGNRNYAHWWIDVVPVLGHHILRRCFGNAIPILPQIRAGYQRQTLDLIPEVRDNFVEIKENECVVAKRLHFVPSLTGGDYHPQPWNSTFIRELKSRIGLDPNKRGHRRIYLSRRDSTARKMINEDKICMIASRQGFEVLETSGMSVIDQIKTFAAASHVVSPHGAGLANMMFSAAGTRMLELQYDNCINWSLRRLAGMANLSYGCIVGRQLPKAIEQTEDQAKENAWHLPEDKFEQVITSRPFI